MWYLISKNKFFSVAMMCVLVALIVVPLTANQIQKWSFEIHKLRYNRAHNEKLMVEFEKQLNLYRAGFDEKMTKLFNVRPTTDQLITFLKTMETMARQSEVRDFELTSLQSAKTNTLQEYPTLRYEAKFQATPEKFRKFLNAFDALPYYLEVSEFQLQSHENVPLQDLADISLTFDLFTR